MIERWWLGGTPERLARRFRPRGPIDLLLRACLLPPDPARAAWRRWAAERTLDGASWPEIRLLTAFSARVAAVDPEGPLVPRLTAIARTNWSVTQSILRESAAALDLLARHGIRCLVFKGAAQYAEGLAGRRLLGDLDLLVRQGDLLTAVEALVAAGWEGQKGESLAYHRAVWPTRIGGNFFVGRHGEIDLHRVPFHVCRHDPALDAALWEGAVPATLAGRAVLVPGAADAILLSISHAVGGSGGDWALDVAARVARQPIDWRALVDTAVRRDLALPALAGLAYLAEELDVAAPPETLAALRRAHDGGLARRNFVVMTRRPGRATAHVQSAHDRLNRALVAGGYDAPVPDRMAVPIVRPRRFDIRRILRVEEMPASTHAEIDVPAGVAALLLRITAPTPPAIPGARPRLLLDAAIAGVAFAQMQVRFSRRQGHRSRRLSFRIALPAGGGPCRVTIAAASPPPRPPQTLTKERDRCAPGVFALDAVVFL